MDASVELDKYLAKIAESGESTTCTLTVNGNTEMYDYTEPPPADSMLVTISQQVVLGNLTLSNAMRMLDRTADLVFLAYTAAQGHGEVTASIFNHMQTLSEAVQSVLTNMKVMSLEATGIVDRATDGFYAISNLKEGEAMSKLDTIAPHVHNLKTQCVSLSSSFSSLAQKFSKSSEDIDKMLASDEQHLHALQNVRTALNDNLNSQKEVIATLSRILGEDASSIKGALSDWDKDYSRARTLSFVKALSTGIGYLSPLALLRNIGNDGGSGNQKSSTTTSPSQNHEQTSHKPDSEAKAQQQLEDAKADLQAKNHAADMASQAYEAAQTDLAGKQAAVKMAMSAENGAEEAQTKALTDYSSGDNDNPAASLTQIVEQKKEAVADALNAETEAKNTLAAATKAKNDAINAQTAAQKLVTQLQEQIKTGTGEASNRPKAPDTTGQNFEKRADTEREYYQSLLEAQEKDSELKIDALEQYGQLQYKLTTNARDSKNLQTSQTALEMAKYGCNVAFVKLTSATTFWTGMSTFCEQIGAAHLQSTITVKEKFESPSERKNYYHGKQFMKMALKTIAGWKALSIICELFSESAASTYAKIIGNIDKGPSSEEALQTIQSLSSQIHKEIAQDKAEADAHQKAIQDKLEHINYSSELKSP
ncbi:hypothetical protein BWQ96_04245 [Gracilariopsis chorda]|uniref:Uncharacterized protein n=1 Tax=Gracilariopsis chorda TaxID=448386 RepID=A0A2V3IV71_9FLOR|nr:hypothetical protein BWQ96_04245 [Gracilariopsis chorda]|eukprot:PXF45989.1 hypothetical protein BWQ96_04245 [Gracilariopsis chorda]